MTHSPNYTCHKLGWKVSRKEGNLEREREKDLGLEREGEREIQRRERERKRKRGRTEINRREALKV